jgi:hypothetical protein
MASRRRDDIAGSPMYQHKCMTWHNGKCVWFSTMHRSPALGTSPHMRLCDYVTYGTITKIKPSPLGWGC